MKNVTIVGAGLVGSLWAVLLRQRGFEVTVFERRADPRKNIADAGRSINLVVTSRGLRALELAGLTNRMKDLAVPVYGRMMHSKKGDLAYQAYGQEGEYNNSVSRGDLNRFLIDEAEKTGAKFHFEHDIADLDLESKTATFRDGFKTQYDILFGTDGAGSRVRAAMVKKRPDLFSDETDWLEADYKEMVIPLGKDGKPQLRTDALHIWPRGAHMMMALANRDGSFTVTLYLPKKGSPSFETVHDRGSVEKLFTEEFPDAIALMPNYADDFLAHPQGSLGTVRAKRWTYENSVALMGDAAHAIVPFFGQGMNCGFEDCTALIQLLDQTTKADANQSVDWKKILDSYQSTRKPNADAIAGMALENWVEMKDKVGDPKFLFRKKVEGALEQKFPELYKSRYGMITYTLVPYSLALKAGVAQDSLLAQIIDGKTTLEEIDWQKAKSVLEKYWLPLVRDHKMDLTRYEPSKK